VVVDDLMNGIAAGRRPEAVDRLNPDSGPI
jgi:hypothetical protein